MVINIIVSILVWSIVVIGMLRVIAISGCKMPSSSLISWIISKSREYPSEAVTKKEYGIIAAEALALRVFMLIAAAIALRLFMDDGQTLTVQGYLDAWQRWDATNYLRIAQGGYAGYKENGEPILLVFFPLYSVLIKGASILLHNMQISAMVVSTICYVGGCCYLFGFVSMEYGKEIAKKAVFYISIFPFSFFLGGMMPESVFFLTASACFYYMQRHQWEKVALTGILAGLSRMQGVLLVIPAAIEWMEYYKPIDAIRRRSWKQLWNDFYKYALWIPWMLLAPLAYLYCNYYVTKDAFKFLEYQKTVWTHEPAYIGKAVDIVFQYLFNQDHIGMTSVAIWLPQTVIIIITFALLVYAIRRHPNKYVLYLLAYTIINFSLTFVISGARYMSVAVPMFIFLAELAERHKWMDKWITVISLVLFGIYLNGYLFTKQIM